MNTMTMAGRRYRSLATLGPIALVALFALLGPQPAIAGACEAHFPLDGNLRDASGNAYHGVRIDSQGVPVGGGEYLEGRFGQALRFDGTAAVVAALDLHPDDCPKVTIAAWVKRNAQPASFSQVVSSGYGHGPKLGAHQTRIDIDGGIASGAAYYSIEPGVWTPIVGTWDFEANELTLHWPGGTLSKPMQEMRTLPQPEFWIGGDGYLGATNHIASGMLIDDVRVWGRVLDDDEIAAVLAGTPPSVARCPCGPGDKPPAGPGPLAPGPTTGDSDGGPLMERPDDLPQEGVTDPDLTVLGDLPTAPPSEYDPEIYLEQQREEYEQNFGPRDRTQAVIGPGFEFGYAATPAAFRAGAGGIGALDSILQGWLSSGKRIRELFRVYGSPAIAAVADDGTFTVQGGTSGQLSAVASQISALKAAGRPIDLVAYRLGDYVILSGTTVHAQGAPNGAVNWAKQRLAAGQQVTALAILNGNRWIGVSAGGVAFGGLSPGDWGLDLLDDVRRLHAAGEVVQDIDAGPGSVTQKWAIATDRRIFVRGFDCRDYEIYGADMESALARTWDCQVTQRNCLANRATWSETDMSSPADPSVFLLNVLVTIGIEDYEDEEKEEFDCWLEEGLKRTELLFGDTPRMEIRLRTRRTKRVDGVDLPDFVMDTDSKYAKYMDDNFDTMAKSRTEGYYQVLVVNDICIGKKDGAPDCAIGGRATFPHVVDPLTRKHGIIMIYPDRRDWVLAHEFGHAFGLVHTFQKSGFLGAASCNDVYPFNNSSNQCNSCQGIVNSTAESCSATYNAMDYCSGDNDDVRLNACQRDKASRQRRRYLTDDGRTDYFNMKGRQGTPYCTSDSECLDDEYCNTGVGTVGRNQCKVKLDPGAACSRGGQCASGQCRLFKCR